MARRYGFDTSYVYNVFGADEHLCVRLWKMNKSGTKWKFLHSWDYSTFLSARVANRLAERRIAKLRAVYGAEPI